MRRTVTRIGKLLGFDQDKQLNSFLWLQHIYRYYLHIYRYLRYRSYRKLKNDLADERADQNDMIIWTFGSRLRNDQQEGTEEEGKGVGFPPPRLKALFPTIEVLQADWEGLFFWIFSEYEPSFYPGKGTFFFTKNKQERRDDVKWRKIAAAKDQKVEFHHLAGRHDTCKTVHLDDLTEHLAMCLNKVQAAEPERSNALLR